MINTKISAKAFFSYESKNRFLYRLHLVDEDGKAFGSTDKSCTVNLTGVYPSSKIGDASLARMSVGEDFGGAWSKQELFKGCALWYGVNSVTFAGAEIEGGWGINARYMTNPLAYIPLSGFNPSYFSEYTREDLITKPLFTSMNDDRMSSTNELNFVDADLRAKMLGDAIPAESFAAGANETGGVENNYNMQIDTPNGWPEERSEEKDGNIVRYWYHSDIKNVSYYYVYKLFEKFIKEN